MLVQKQAPKRLRNLLVIGAAMIFPVLGYVVYQNFSNSSTAPEVIGLAAQRTVPDDFGQNFFRDARFNALVPKQGTALITQSSVIVPSETLLAPKAVQVFDMQSGGTVLFTWKKPEGAAAATGIRLQRVAGADRSNIATLPASATSYQYRGATDAALSSYELYYISQLGVADSPAVLARAGATGGWLTVAAASNDGVKLTWTKPVGTFAAVEVYRSTTVGDLGQRLARLGADETSYDDAQGRPDIYFYLVRWVASDIDGQAWQGQVASSDHEAPAAPQAVNVVYVDKTVAGEVTPGFVRLTWSPSPSPDVVGYEIFRSASAMTLGTKIGSKDLQDIASIAEISADPALAKDCARQYCLEDRSFAPGTTLLKGIPYYYTAIAIDQAGNRSSLQELGASGRPNPFISL